MLLKCKNRKINGAIDLVRSKSESNRALLIRSMCDSDFEISNLSHSDDTIVLKEALQNYRTKTIIDVHHAGTAFRFLTAFLAVQCEGEWLLTGSERMQERPIAILVEALRGLGARITYLKNDGFPPLKIEGTKISKNEITIDGSVSSQYISALLLVAPTLKQGLSIHLTSDLVSKPYIEMTLSIMKNFEILYSQQKNVITIAHQRYQSKAFEVESDWSAASYWYSIIALSEMGSSVKLQGLKVKSLQGDAALIEIYKQLGVVSSFENDGWVLSKKLKHCETLVIDLCDSPDIAQTLICTCAGLGMSAKISGLKTLKIKETDRVAAMKTELQKFNILLEVNSLDEVYLSNKSKITQPKSSIETYQDHRMAMAFAPLVLKVKELEISNPEVVSKSYPNFWEDLKSVGLI